MLGAHVNLFDHAAAGDPAELAGLDAEERGRHRSSERFVRDLSGYMKIQATRPQTVAYGLTDSPVGQLAWIVEKFREWTDSAKVPEDAVDRDLILTNVIVLLADPDRGLLGPVLLRDGRRTCRWHVSTGRLRRRCRCRSGSRCSRTRRSRRSAGWPSGTSQHRAVERVRPRRALPGAGGAGPVRRGPPGLPPDDRPVGGMTPGIEDFRTVGRRLSNWGRWGRADERGTVNLITPELLVAAARLVSQGRGVRPRHPAGRHRPAVRQRAHQPGAPDVRDRAEQVFPGGFRFADDYIFMGLQSSTQWDALAHVYYDEQYYNGFPAAGTTVKGGSRCTIDRQAAGIAGRGVLLDIAGLHGVDWLETGTVITPEDLDAACAAQNVSVGAGDILLFRTGWRRKFLHRRRCPGVHGRRTRPRPAVLRMAARAGRGGGRFGQLGDRGTAQRGRGALLNVHMILIRDMGMSLCEILDLEQLTADCLADGCWEFLFVAPPLPISRAVGSPVNPLALK